MKFRLAIKRAIDVLLSALLLIVGLPLMIVLALTVKLSSRGPVFFVQERAGLHGRPFRIWKFRTMAYRPEKAQATVWTRDDEERIIPVLKLLRDYGLDELPQLINILMGDMSIIGPRPPLSAQARAYTAYQRQMFQMRPGVLSLAAIKGRRSIPTAQRIAWHVEYVKNWSLGLDWMIFWRSLLVILRRQNADEVAIEPEPPDEQTPADVYHTGR